MSYDIQKASFLKRIAAAMLDFIMLTIIVTGAAWVMSLIASNKEYVSEFESIRKSYEEEYNIDFDLKEGDKELSEVEKIDYKERYKKAEDAFLSNKRANELHYKMMSFIILNISISIFIGFLLLEFVVPVILKNGQTIGKKVFNIGVIRVDGVKINTMLLFIRAILGKYTIETMVPVFIFLLMINGALGFVGTIVLFGLLILQIVVIFTSKYRMPIHDLLAQTVAVDLSTQFIFQSSEDLLKYKQKIHNESVEKTEY